MIGIIVSGHINFATGIKSAVDAIVGEQESIEFIDFVPEITTEQLEQKMLEAIERVDTGKGVLFLTDVVGGTPCNRAMSIMLERQNINVIGGTNLPMITNACFERDGVSLDELTEIVLEIGASTMKDMKKELELISNSNADEFEDAL